MKTDQVVDGIGKAVAASTPAQEYCLLWLDWWPMCMTKAEWSGWMQAIFSVLAIAAAVWVATRQRRQVLKDAEDKEISLIRACLRAVLDASEALNDVHRKISGERRRPPDSSYSRIESIERTFQILLTKEIPEVMVKPILIALREIAYTKRAIEETMLKPPDPESGHAGSALKRTFMIANVSLSIKKELDKRVGKRKGFTI